MFYDLSNAPDQHITEPTDFFKTRSGPGPLYPNLPVNIMLCFLNIKYKLTDVFANYRYRTYVVK